LQRLYDGSAVCAAAETEKGEEDVVLELA